jgi:hypothetical protein
MFNQTDSMQLKGSPTLPLATLLLILTFLLVQFSQLHLRAINYSTFSKPP